MGGWDIAKKIFHRAAEGAEYIARDIARSASVGMAAGCAAPRVFDETQSAQCPQAVYENRRLFVENPSDEHVLIAVLDKPAADAQRACVNRSLADLSTRIDVAMKRAEGKLDDERSKCADRACEDAVDQKRQRTVNDAGRVLTLDTKDVCGVPADVTVVEPRTLSAAMLLSRNYAGIAWDDYDRTNTATETAAIISIPRGGPVTEQTTESWVTDVTEVHGNKRLGPSGHVQCLYSPGLKSGNPEPAEMTQHPGPGGPTVVLPR